MRVSVRGIRVLSVALVTLGAVGLGTTQAQAYPSNCRSTIATWKTQAYGWCNSGTGQFKEVITCKNAFAFYAYREGPWVNVGANYSWATCPLGYTVQSAWIVGR